MKRNNSKSTPARVLVPFSLTKQNELKQNYFSPANLEYKPGVLIAASNTVYRMILLTFQGFLLHLLLSIKILR